MTHRAPYVKRISLALLTYRKGANMEGSANIGQGASEALLFQMKIQLMQLMLRATKSILPFKLPSFARSIVGALYGRNCFRDVLGGLENAERVS